MQITAIRILPEPDIQHGRHVFKVASPVLARSESGEGKIRHLLYSDEEADAVITQTLRHKMDKAGMKDAAMSTHVRFDRQYQKARTKLVTIKGIAHRASICPVIIEGSVEAMQFAWNVGIGHSTGSGFGALV